MTKLTRRGFLKTAAGTTLCGMTALSATNVSGANERIRLALVGVGNKGKNHAMQFAKLSGVEIAVLCDADKERADEVDQRLEKTGLRPRLVEDMRKVCDDKSIDAVIISSPNHWHALAAIWALQAGKHVYVEKPVCHNVFEGAILLKAAKKYEKIVQGGFQNRSDVGLKEFYSWLNEGNLGRITLLYGQCLGSRNSIGKQSTPLTVPPEVNYDLWLGPAENLPIYRPGFHYDWHWMWNTGNGDIGNQGCHELDLMQWFRGDSAMPKRVMSFGGRFGWDDAGETANTQLAVFDFGDYPCYFEVRNMSNAPDLKGGPANHGIRTGIYVQCENGYFCGGRGGGKAYDNNGNVIKQFKGDGGREHQQNFLDAVRGNNPGLIRSRIEDAVKSSDLSHLANASLRVGKLADRNEVANALNKDAKALETLDLFEKHLAAWSIDTGKTKYQLGSWLDFDPKRLRFAGGENFEAANQMLTRSYRKEFEIGKDV